MPVRKMPPTIQEVSNMALEAAKKIIETKPLFLNALPEEDFNNAMKAIMEAMATMYVEGWVARGNATKTK